MRHLQYIIEKKSMYLLLFLYLACIAHSHAQSKLSLRKNDTIVSAKSPILMRNSLIFSRPFLGWQSGIGKLVSQREKHILRASGHESVRTRSRFLYANVGYYNQPSLHQNWFLTAEYSMYHILKNGFYTEFTPMLGVSRTFLPNTTYEIGANNVVKQVKFAGNWYLTTGFSAGIGKSFSKPKHIPLKAINAKLVSQIFYPNFRFFALKPYFELNSIWEINKIQTVFSKNISYKYRHETKSN
jgi:hypothetical protein